MTIQDPQPRVGYSPAPWSRDPEGLVAVSIEDAAGNVVCDVHGASNDPRCEANCALIEAAPALLAALESLCESVPPNQYAGSVELQRYAALWENARDAVRMARGE